MGAGGAGEGGGDETEAARAATDEVLAAARSIPVSKPVVRVAEAPQRLFDILKRQDEEMAAPRVVAGDLIFREAREGGASQQEATRFALAFGAILGGGLKAADQLLGAIYRPGPDVPRAVPAPVPLLGDVGIAVQAAPQPFRQFSWTLPGFRGISFRARVGLTCPGFCGQSDA